MHIVHIAAEIAPMAKVGGLADVVGGLSLAQAAAGLKVDVLIPGYHLHGSTQSIPKEQKSSSVEERRFHCWWAGHTYEASASVISCSSQNSRKGILLHRLDSSHPKEYFKRPSIYGYPDDVERFVHFCRLSLDYLVKEGIRPDILHLHDWQGAAAALLSRGFPFKEHFAKTKSILTLHNVEYQGWIDKKTLEAAGVDFSIHGAHHSTLLAAGIEIADAVTTVSPTYAQEILHPEAGRGLETLLQRYRAKFSGILNGIDTDYWNPAHDPLISRKYTAEDVLIGKRENRCALSQAIGIAVRSDVPLIACVTRLVAQKGIQFIRHAIQMALGGQAQMVLIASLHGGEYDREFQALAHSTQEHPNCRLILTRSEERAHQLFASADITLVPSLFEPCGLTQLIAYRYGSIPLVRHTGGLADTVSDVQQGGVGFVFLEPEITPFHTALERALSMWRHSSSLWHELVQRAMKQEVSWDVSEKKYRALYLR